MKKGRIVNKKKLIVLILLILVLLIFVLGLVFYLKPIKISDEVFENVKVEITLNRRITNCKITNTVNEKHIDDKIIDILKEDGYKKKDGLYVKSIKVENTCDTLYKEYAKDNAKLKLNGTKDQVVEVNDKYDDQGYDYDGKDKIKTINNVDTSKIGSYNVVYELQGSILNKYVIRNVEVKDTTKPNIILNGSSTITMNVGDEYNEPGYTASDNYDGDITSNVIVESNVDTSKEGDYNIIYKVEDSSGNEFEVNRKVSVKQKTYYTSSSVSGLTYINGILIVNKKYGLPKDYDPGVNPEANDALKRMQADASVLGLDLKLVSGYISYSRQSAIYNNYVKINGQAKADTFSARPGYSEHQTGLAFDVGSIKGSFANTSESKWLEENCHLYGFIIRYPKGKTDITGYIYEPWHIRYLGVETATKVKESGLTLEEYLGIK